jgi:hypothetical protein
LNAVLGLSSRRDICCVRLSGLLSNFGTQILRILEAFEVHARGLCSIHLSEALKLGLSMVAAVWVQPAASSTFAMPR